MKYMMVAFILALGSCGGIVIPPIPTPTPTPTPEPTPPPECLPGVPWCKDVQQQCSSPESPCKTNPSPDPEYCEYAFPCPTPPPAEPETCEGIAHPDDPRWTPLTRPAQMQEKVRAAIARVAGECGGNCGPDWIQTLRRLARYLNEAGHCATGPWVDSLAVLAPDGNTEEYHPVFSGNGSWTDSGHGKYITSWRLVEGEPLDCGGSFARWNQQCPAPFAQWFHCTPLVGPSLAFCRSQGLEREFCPPRPNGHSERQACEVQIMGGYASWHSDGEVILRNPLMARCVDCTYLEICLPDGTNCKRVSIN